MLTYWEILTAIQSNVPVNDSYAQLWGRKAQGSYTVVTYIGTLPAVLTGTGVGYLHRYKIYGNTEQIGTPTPENPIIPSECGERTAQLWDEEYLNGYYTSSNTFMSANNQICSKSKMAVNPKTTYWLGVTSRSGIAFLGVLKYNENAEFIERENTESYKGNGVVFTTDASTYYININFGAYYGSVYRGDIVIAESSTPISYEPYGYKLPLTSAGQGVDIYIGDDTLSTEEYVDSGTGKIYRMVGGVLTPVDPPVPFPQIPTSANSTTISWAGEGLAPSQVELKYEKKR